MVRGVRLAVAVVLGMVVLAACGNGGGPEGIEDREWFLVALGDAADPMPADPSRLATALFQDGQVTGVGPCNAFTAPYQLGEETGEAEGEEGEGEPIVIGDVASTRALCGEPALDDQETRYFTFLPMARSFTVDDESLRIDVEGDRVLQFREDVGGD